MNGFIWTRRAVFIFIFIHLLPLNKRPTTCGVLLQSCLLCGIFKKKRKHLLRLVFARWPVTNQAAVAFKIFMRPAKEKIMDALIQLERWEQNATYVHLQTHLTQRASVLSNLRPSSNKLLEMQWGRPVLVWVPRKKRHEPLCLREQTMVNTIVPFSSREPFYFTVNEMGSAYRCFCAD